MAAVFPMPPIRPLSTEKELPRRPEMVQCTNKKHVLWRQTGIQSTKYLLLPRVALSEAGPVRFGVSTVVMMHLGYLFVFSVHSILLCVECLSSVHLSFRCFWKCPGSSLNKAKAESAVGVSQMRKEG